MGVRAAVVHSFDTPPRYEPFDLPAPSDGDQALVDVLAVGLHPRVRTGASGSRYTSTAKFRLQGNGQGAVSTRTYLEELPSLIDEIESGGLAVIAKPVPLADIETAWTGPEVPGVRTVLVP
jgi:hypothetical protein